VYQQEQQQQQEQQDAENPFLDPPFSRIKINLARRRRVPIQRFLSELSKNLFGQIINLGSRVFVKKSGALYFSSIIKCKRGKEEGFPFDRFKASKMDNFCKNIHLGACGFS
jgi:hypothetical protein